MSIPNNVVTFYLLWLQQSWFQITQPRLVFDFFEVYKLIEAKHLAYCNNDVETLNLVLLWQANIGEVEIPSVNPVAPNASKSLRLIKQKQKLQRVKHELGTLGCYFDKSLTFTLPVLL